MAEAAAWIEFVIGTIGVLLILLGVIGAPKYSRPLLAEPSFDPTAVVGIILGLAGYVWMLRIFFAGPERDAPHWRYRTPRN
jgi:Flp pilus assembly protein TadB